jgi:CO dehydrogenase/acetyl-CoA synthase beta subunit
LTGKKKAKIDLIVSLESAIKEKRLVYKQAQDKIKEEEQLVLDEAEAERVKEEQARLLEEAEKAETPEEREALEEKADEVVEKVVTAPTVVNDKQKVASGGSTTWIKDIEVVITDAKQVCKSVASGAIPITVVEIKPTKLKAWAKLTLVPEGKYKGFNIINKDRERVRS